jgi:hypothetical protein|tara:strand:+ start:1245 stop:2225 length:981 start_codon:yes stop_codon:yes gene_type:complete
MNWFDIIKSAVEDETVIWKMPYTSGGNRYFNAQLSEIPGLLKLLSADTNPLMNYRQREGIKDLIPRNTEIRVYPLYQTLSETGDGKKTYLWRPSIIDQQKSIMIVTILDKEGKPIQNWQKGALTMPNGAEAPTKMKQLASGQESFEIQEDEIGINIIYIPGKGAVKIDGHVGFNGEYWNGLSNPQRITEGASIDDYDLSNGAAAILLILTTIVPYGLTRGKEKRHKQRQEEIAKLGLGEWSRTEENNKYVNELLDKGLLERRRTTGKGTNMLPIPTAKGKVVSNRFEMKQDYFDEEFAREVRANPDEPFDSFGSTDIASDDPDFGV